MEKMLAEFQKTHLNQIICALNAKQIPITMFFISLMLSTIVQIGQMIQFQGNRALKMFQNNIYIILPTEMYWKDIRLAK